MPRLGGPSAMGGSSSSGGRNHRNTRGMNILGNYISNIPKLNIRNVVLFLVAFFIVRNFLRNDYRKEEIQYLRNSGMTEEQIERYIPKTPTERKKYIEDKKNDVERMKKDIAYLLNEVAELKAGLMASSKGSNASHPDGTTNNGRLQTLKSMDHVHEEKRKMKEDQLLKDHPDFKPSKRLKDMTEEELQSMRRM